jgi:hypothetical protein
MVAAAADWPEAQLLTTAARMGSVALFRSI